jgi:hypothetical protein
VTKDPHWGLFSAEVEASEYPSYEKHQAHLFDQYKLYVEMADRISGRRLTANSYFLSINSALLVFVGYITSKEGSEHLWLVGIAGIVLSMLWYRIVTSYRDLNTAKYKIIHLIESRLPIRPWDAEWNLLGHGNDPKRYRPLSHIERFVPWVFVVLHVYVVVRGVPWTSVGRALGITCS